MTGTLFEVDAPAVQNIVLRPYQEQAANTVLAGFDRGVQRGLVVMPTGTGKTTLFSEIIRRVSVPSMILAHRGELLEQAAARIRSQVGLRAMIESGKFKSDESADVVVASVQALGRSNTSRLTGYQPGLMIIDEAHHAAADSYQTIMRRYGCYTDFCRVMGVTATPHRMDNKPLHGTAHAIFEEILFAFTLKDAILDGWLADLRGYRVKTDVDLTKVKTTAGDYDQGQLQKAVNIHARNAAAFEHWTDVAGDQKTIIFCSGVDHAADVAGLFADRGIKAEHVTGAMKADQRDAIMSRFREGRTQVLVNVDIATEGFDVPDASCVVLLRPTKSWALFTQMVGRGLRVLPNTIEGIPDASARRDAIARSAKPACIVIEIVDDGEEGIQSLTANGMVGDAPDAPSITAIVDLPARLDLKGHGLVEALDIFDDLPPQKQAYLSRRDVSFDDLSSTLVEVDLLGELAVQDEVLNLSKYAWLKISPSEYVLPCGDSDTEKGRLARLSMDALGDWWVHYASSTMTVHGWKAGQDLKDAFRRADDGVVKRWPFIRGLINHQARWREMPPSESQVRYMRALKIDPDVIALIKTAGEASLLIERTRLGRVA